MGLLQQPIGLRGPWQQRLKNCRRHRWRDHLRIIVLVQAYDLYEFIKKFCEVFADANAASSSTAFEVSRGNAEGRLTWRDHPTGASSRITAKPCLLSARTRWVHGLLAVGNTGHRSALKANLLTASSGIFKKDPLQSCAPPNFTPQSHSRVFVGCVCCNSMFCKRPANPS